MKENLSYDHLPHNEFVDKADVLRRGLEELAKGNIPKEAIALGTKYRREIEVGYEPNVSIRWVSEKVGYGAFAEEVIEPDTFVGEYTGVVRENVRVYFQPLNNYCYEYPVPDDIGRSFVIDATKGNFTRFINHSKKPNLKPVYAFLDGFYHLILISLCKIEKGEQLSYEYGARYWWLRDPPEEI
jgi:hypothetical protein